MGKGGKGKNKNKDGDRSENREGGKSRDGGRNRDDAYSSGNGYGFSSNSQSANGGNNYGGSYGGHNSYGGSGNQSNSYGGDGRNDSVKLEKEEKNLVDKIRNKSLIAVLNEHGGTRAAARGSAAIQELMRGDIGEDSGENEVWDAVEAIQYQTNSLRRLDLELCTRLYKRGWYKAHYLYLSNFPDYDPSSVARKGPGQDLPAVMMVAEKPSIAKIITEHLSGGRYRTRRCISRACQTYEFVHYFTPARQRCKVICTSVIGHLYGLSFAKQRGLKPEAMFWADTTKEIEDTSRKMRVVEHLQELAGESEYLALWLDCDREGENICYEVIGSVREHFPSDANIYRAHFSAITESEIKYAYENLQRPNKHMAMAVDARQELDLKVGIAFSTLLKWEFLEAARAKFPRSDLKMLTYGPCQTPTLWFCVQRHKEIQAFKKERWYQPTFTYMDLTFKQEQQWSQPRNMPTGRGVTVRAQVLNQWDEKKKLRRPVGLNTVQMLKAASALGMSPGTAMKVAEDLYSAGYVSYPRTESTKYADSYNVTEVLEQQAKSSQWGKMVGVFLRQNNYWINPPQEGYDAGDHPPITPCGQIANKDDFKKVKQWKLYEYICRHFIATCLDDCTYTEYTVEVRLERVSEPFTCVYHVVHDRGFLYATPWKADSLSEIVPGGDSGNRKGGKKGGGKDDNRRKADPISSPVRLPNSWVVRDLKIVEGSTEPPQYLKESELVALMDKHGIGTDASMAGHIDNVVTRNYCMVCGPCTDGSGKAGAKIMEKGKGKGKTKGGEKPVSRHMVPTGLGLAILDMFHRLVPDMCEPKVRGFMEKQVAQIAEGTNSKEVVVRENLELFESRFTHFWRNLDEVRFILDPKGEFKKDKGRGKDNANNNRNNNATGHRIDYDDWKEDWNDWKGGNDWNERDNNWKDDGDWKDGDWKEGDWKEGDWNGEDEW